jgi:hypothetical protein
VVIYYKVISSYLLLLLSYLLNLIKNLFLDICNPNIPYSTDLPISPFVDKGGYNVQPVPIPLSIIDDIKIRKRDTGNNQNDKPFILGQAISLQPIKIGIK